MDDTVNDAVKSALSFQRQRQLQLKKKCDLPTKIESQSNDFQLYGKQMNIYVRAVFLCHPYFFMHLIISVRFFQTHTHTQPTLFYSLTFSRKIGPRGWLCSAKTNETFNNNLAKRNIRRSADKITLYQNIQIQIQKQRGSLLDTSIFVWQSTC